MKCGEFSRLEPSNHRVIEFFAKIVNEPKIFDFDFAIICPLLNKFKIIMKDKFEQIQLTPREKFIEFVGNALVILMLLAFFMKIVLF